VSDLASVHRTASSRLSYIALAFALGSLVFYLLAGTTDDGLYVVAGALAVVAFALGVKARRDDRRAGLRGRFPLVAIIVGGLLGGAVIAFSIVWGISQLV